MNKFLPFLAVVTLSGALSGVLAEDLDGFGRLFTKPEERALINQSRQLTKTTSSAWTYAQNKLSADIAMSGFIRRDQAMRVIWLNHQPVYLRDVSETEALDIFSVLDVHHPCGADTGLTVAGISGLCLKAGQVYRVQTDQIVQIRPLLK